MKEGWTQSCWAVPRYYPLAPSGEVKLDAPLVEWKRRWILLQQLRYNRFPALLKWMKTVRTGRLMLYTQGASIRPEAWHLTTFWASYCYIPPPLVSSNNHGEKSMQTTSRSAITCERKLHTLTLNFSVFQAAMLQFSLYNVGRVHCKTANLPGIAFSYRRWPHWGHGCRAHISSLLRSRNSENQQFSQEAMPVEIDPESCMVGHYNLLSISWPIMQCNNKMFLSAHKQRDHLACLTNLMVALLLIT